MAKDQSHLADLTIGDDKSWLTNLLAEEAVWDRRTLWQLGSWAAGSVGALVIAVLSVHASSDMRREQVAALDLSRQAQQLQTIARDGAVVNRQLASQIETLNGDRDRLYARITVLEQGLDSVTGAVARQSPPSSLALSSAAQALAVPPPLISAPATIAAIEAAQPVQTETPTQATLTPITPAPPTSPPAPAPGFAAHATTPAPATPTQTPAQTAAQSPAQTPAEAALASTMPHGPMAPAAKQLLPSSTVYAPPDPGAPQLDTRPAALPVMAKGDSKGDNQADARAAPKADAKTELKADLKPDSGSEAKSAGKTDRPVTSSFIPKSNPADPPPPLPTPAHAATAATTPVPEVPVLRTDFGVDLGTANSVEGLRALWQGLLKSDASLLSSLRPIMVIKERGNGLGMQLRLVAGPLTDAAAAAKICAVLAESDRGCETAVFDGQRLSVKTDVAEEPVTTSAIPAIPKVVPGKSRYYTRRVRHEAYRPRAQAPPAAAPPPPASSSPSFLPGFLRH